MILPTRRAIYPGSFDPITIGHLDVALRASRLFDEVVVAIYEGSQKPGALFTPDERFALAVEAVKDYSNITVDRFSGLTVNYVRSLDSGIIVRGLRAVSDFEYEFKLAHMNDHLAPDVEVVCLMTSADHSFISSSFIREVALLGGDISGLVPDHVRDALREKIAAGAGSW
jgi:pantetheine-phosphate adenylyltransferase